MLKRNIKRSGEFTPIPRPLMFKAHRKRCGVCRLQYGRIKAWTDPTEKPLIYIEEAIHHLIPRRMLNQYGIYEHQTANLFSICNQCHGRAKVFEDRLFHGDVIGFLVGMKLINFPVERIIKFAISVGLKEFSGVNL